MSHDDSRSRRAELPERLRLLTMAQAGRLDGLPCPRCRQEAVSVWFTHPAPAEFRTWFQCGNCDFEMRAQNSGRPPFYSLERDRTPTEEAQDAGAMTAEHGGG